ncbi:MAG: histidine kinase dimerization/phospho-acceptor domain-containing protein [bacterium]
MLGGLLDACTGGERGGGQAAVARQHAEQVAHGVRRLVGRHALDGARGVGIEGGERIETRLAGRASASRTPFNAMLTSGEFLQRPSSDPALQHAAKRIVASGTRMARLIEDVHDLVRSRLAGGLPLRRERTELEAVIRRSIAEYETTHPHCRIEMQIDGDVSGDWDPQRLAQLVANLVGKAALGPSQ